VPLLDRVPGRPAGAIAAALVLTALAGCSAGSAAYPTTATTAPGRSPATTATPSVGDDTAQVQFARLEEQADARLGLFAVDTGTSRTLAHRADERFAFASTYKALAAGALLARTSDADLDAVVTWHEGDLVAHSPVTAQHVRDGLPLREVAQAAVTVSDNTAADVVLARLGGPAGLQGDLRALGDATTTIASGEPEVNDVDPGDVADTSTPAALAGSLRAYATGTVLAPDDRDQLVQWLRTASTGDDQVRAGVPQGWVVGDKTGHTGRYGHQADIAVVWPPGGRAPWVLAVLSDRAALDAPADPALLAAATRVVVAQWS